MKSIKRAPVLVMRTCLDFHTSLLSDRKPMHFPDLLGYRLLIIITKHVGRLNRCLLRVRWVVMATTNYCTISSVLARDDEPSSIVSANCQFKYAALLQVQVQVTFPHEKYGTVYGT